MAVVGCWEGLELGRWEGRKLGCSEGLLVGDTEGAWEGDKLADGKRSFKNNVWSSGPLCSFRRQ